MEGGNGFRILPSVVHGAQNLNLVFWFDRYDFLHLTKKVFVCLRWNRQFRNSQAQLGMQTAVKCSRHLQNTPPARPPTLVGQPHWLHSRAGCSYAALHMTTHWYTRGKRGVVESSPAAIVLPSHTHVSYLQANEGIEFKEGTKFNLCERNICTGQFDENSACEQECSPCSMYSGIHHTALHCIERLTKQDLPTPSPML